MLSDPSTASTGKTAAYLASLDCSFGALKSIYEKVAL